jgi:hypothetical protein
MRLVAIAILAIGISSCNQQKEVDPMDARIELTAIDTSQVDWRAIGPIDPLASEPFVWSCGTFDRTPEEIAVLDSIYAVFRSKGMIFCY